MKKNRQTRILELIEERNIGTQEELTKALREENFDVTQATVSRDIRNLKLMKVTGSDGKRRYSVMKQDALHADKYIRILKDAYVSADIAKNILVFRTVSGMASPVGAALDSMKMDGVLGCVSGDDTVIIVLKTDEDAARVLKSIKEMI